MSTNHNEEQKSTNYCKNCRVNNFCLPTQLDQNTLKTLDQLNFKSFLLEPGQHLFRQGDLLSSLYAVRSGILKSYTTTPEGQEYVMGFYLPPALLGWEAIDINQLSISMVALDNCNVCEIPLNQLEIFIKEMPEISRQLLQMVSKRIHQDNDALLRTTAEQRVANFILQLSKNYTLLGFPYYMCKLLMTHQDIANYLRIAPETISRIFHSFKAKNLISISRKSIYLNDIEKLKEIAGIN